MQYYVWIEENVTEPDYGNPIALFRLEINKEGIITEVWDAKNDTWQHDPEVIAATEIGGASDYHQVEEHDLDTIKKT